MTVVSSSHAALTGRGSDPYEPTYEMRHEDLSGTRNEWMVTAVHVHILGIEPKQAKHLMAKEWRRLLVQLLGDERSIR